MKSIEELAREAYIAFARLPADTKNWGAVLTDEKSRWIAVAQKLRAEIQAIH